ncbi:hypothetical protein Dalk_4565 [Desulfatibacillum aliphaticivorans]|uniref:Uncharacterized protein n=1 Tax=Desulfatibacillum aliphaticivorans TaxID=218208 RepID=B8FNG2_DESAL|nr:hypothetical protein [Desulfatibacillum aliphaticivorans]ACL06243.1 hypothetical protein Dalk_4565 [Desulfatibacillum aliphaticivorans]
MKCRDCGKYSGAKYDGAIGVCSDFANGNPMETLANNTGCGRLEKIVPPREPVHIYGLEKIDSLLSDVFFTKDAKRPPELVSEKAETVVYSAVRKLNRDDRFFLTRLTMASDYNGLTYPLDLNDFYLFAIGEGEESNKNSIAAKGRIDSFVNKNKDRIGLTGTVYLFRRFLNLIRGELRDIRNKNKQIIDEFNSKEDQGAEASKKRVLVSASIPRKEPSFGGIVCSYQAT